MKRGLALLAVFLSAAMLCLPAAAQSAEPGGSLAQDMLIKGVVETAVSAMKACFALYKEGQMTFEQAKMLGANLLRELSYGQDGYFWADTTEGVNVVLYGRKDTEGRNRLEDKDSLGNFYVKEFLAKAAVGGGYVQYWFPRMGKSQAEPKRSYVLPFEPFGWVIGTGYYLNS